MVPVHVHNMIGRCLDHLIAFCQKNRLQYIYHLCKCRHLDAITMLVEYVEGNSRYKRIAHSVLLI